MAVPDAVSVAKVEQRGASQVGRVMVALMTLRSQERSRPASVASQSELSQCRKDYGVLFNIAQALSDNQLRL